MESLRAIGAGARSAERPGSVTTKVDPLPGPSLWAFTSPPCTKDSCRSTSKHSTGLSRDADQGLRKTACVHACLPFESVTLARTQSILIPVGPSTIDIHATANFIKELLLIGKVRFRNIRLAVIANRVRSSRPVYEPLERFVGSLGISFITRVSDSDVYVDAAETGVGVFEMPADKAGAEQREFLPIGQWVLGETEVATAAPPAVAPVEPVYDASNVVQLAAARA